MSDDSSPTTPPPSSSGDRWLSSRLDREWWRLRCERRTIARAHGWELVDAELADLQQLLGAVGFGTAPTPHAEHRLRQLVLTARHDTLAARIVLQRLLPGIGALAARRAPWIADAYDELIGSLWIAIRTFNPDRQPASIALALLSDADDLAARREWRRRGVEVVPLGDDEPSDGWSGARSDARFDARSGGWSGDWSDESNADAATELARVLRSAGEAGAAPWCVTLLAELANEPSAAALARRHRVSERTIRDRRARATNEIRRVIQVA